MPDAAELLKLIKQSALEAVDASKPVRFFFGEVMNTEPLQINVEQKMQLGRKQLTLSRSVTDFETEITVDTDTEQALDEHSHALAFVMEGAGEPLHVHTISGSTESVGLTHTHEIKKRMKITVHNRLAVGDKVILLQNKGGQQYLVLDRIG
ncbi:MAG: DUF2577 domain-containing protein [Lachnospiraceae bacterium]|nr:DUF2577 domain-containing protein [Lachnospiraceae bacterium]